MTSLERAENLLNRLRPRHIIKIPPEQVFKKGQRIRFQGPDGHQDFIIKKVNRKKLPNGKMQITGYQLREAKE